MTDKAASYHEKRGEPRFDGGRVKSLKILFASETPNLLGKNVATYPLDISAHGLGFVLTTEVPVKSTLDLRIQLKDSDKQYFLSAVVLRCVATGNGDYTVGLKLRERTDTETDLDSWKKALS